MSRFSMFKANFRFWWWKAHTIHAQRYLSILVIVVMLAGVTFYSFSGHIRPVYAATAVTQTSGGVSITGGPNDVYYIDAGGVVHWASLSAKNGTWSNQVDPASDRVTLSSTGTLSVSGSGTGNAPTVYMSAGNVDGGGTVNLAGLSVTAGAILRPMDANRDGAPTLYSRADCWGVQLTFFVKLTAPANANPAAQYRYRILAGGGTGADSYENIQTVPSYDGTSSIDSLGLAWVQGSSSYPNFTGRSTPADWASNNLASISPPHASDLVLNPSQSGTFPVRIRFNYPDVSDVNPILRFQFWYNVYDKNTGNLLSGPTQNVIPLTSFYAPEQHGKINNVQQTMRIDAAYQPDSVLAGNSSCEVRRDFANLLSNGRIYRFHEINVSGTVGQMVNYWTYSQSGANYDFNLANLNIQSDVLSNLPGSGNTYPYSWYRDYSSNSYLIDGVTTSAVGGKLIIATSTGMTIDSGGSVNAVGSGYPGARDYIHNNNIGDCGWGGSGNTCVNGGLSYNVDDAPAGAQYGGGAWRDAFIYSGGGGGAGSRKDDCGSCFVYPGGGGGGTMGNGGVSMNIPPNYGSGAKWYGGGGSGYQGAAPDGLMPGNSHRENYVHGTNAGLGGGGGTGANTSATKARASDGGGKIDLRSGSVFTINGVIDASGGSSQSGDAGGGGGGTVFLRATSNSINVGSNGYVKAEGSRTSKSVAASGGYVLSEITGEVGGNLAAAGGGGGLIDMDAQTINLPNGERFPDFCDVGTSFRGSIDNGRFSTNSGNEIDGSQPGTISIPVTFSGSGVCAGSNVTGTSVVVTKMIQQWNGALPPSTTQADITGIPTSSWVNVVSVATGSYIRIVVAMSNYSSTNQAAVQFTDTLPAPFLLPASTTPCYLVDTSVPSTPVVVTPNRNCSQSGTTIAYPNFSIPGGKTYTLYYIAHM